MAKDKTTIRLWLREDRLTKNGLAPVHIIYQVKGERGYYAVPGISILPVNWDNENQVAIYRDKKAAKKIDPLIDPSFLLSSAGVEEINSKIQAAKTDVNNAEIRFRLDGKIISAKEVIKSLRDTKRPVTEKSLPQVNILDFILRFVDDSKATHKEGTLKVFRGLAAQIASYEKSKGIKLTFENLDEALIGSFHGHLTQPHIIETKKNKKLKSHVTNVTATKQISTLKTILNYARKRYKITVNQDYKDYKVSRSDSDFEVITLTNDEFEAIFKLDLSDNKRLDQVRDVFCFSCATGLRFSDLVQLRREHIRKDNTLRLTASKTGQTLVIPLNPYSQAILNKYKERLSPLPMISNQKTNDYIKEIGGKAEIDTPIEIVRYRGKNKVVEVFPKHELLSIHVGRKSFITLSLEKGIPIQDVMSLSGHTTFKAFRRYVNVSDNRKKTVMAEAWGKIESNLKAV